MYVLCINTLSQAQQSFSEEPNSKNSHFFGHMVSVRATQLCSCSSVKKRHGCVPIKRYLQNRLGNGCGQWIIVC